METIFKALLKDGMGVGENIPVEIQAGTYGDHRLDMSIGDKTVSLDIFDGTVSLLVYDTGHDEPVHNIKLVEGISEFAI